MTGFSPISPPMDCNKMVIDRGKESDGFLVRTDPNDPVTEEEVPSGQGYQMIANTGTFTTAFPAGKPVCWVKALSQVGTMIVKSTR